VMFLDLAGSTALAEQLGELRVHDIVTPLLLRYRSADCRL